MEDLIRNLIFTLGDVIGSDTDAICYFLTSGLNFL